MINDNNDDAVQLLAQQRIATAQSKAHRRGRLSVYSSPVVILAQKAAFCTKPQLPDVSQVQNSQKNV